MSCYEFGGALRFAADVSCNRHNHWKNFLLTLGGALRLRFGCYCFRRMVETLLNDFSEKDILAQNSGQHSEGWASPQQK
jgi:hypothetical protein